MNMIIPKDHISLASSKAVAEICAPLFTHFGLKLFVYNRSYSHLKPGDKQGFALFSHPDWAEFFFRNDYQHRLTFTGMEPYENINGYRFILTSLFPENRMLQNLREYYDIDHGIIVFRQYEQYYEWCTFATDRQNQQILHFYLNQSEQLIHFIACFKSQAKQILQQAEQQRLILPAVDNAQRIYLRDGVQNILEGKRATIFTKQTKLKHYLIHLKNTAYQLTAREMDCLYYLRRVCQPPQSETV